MPTTPHSTSLRTALVGLAASLLAAPLAIAEDAPAKRKEGHYFVELAEIMLTTEQFDVDVATIDPGGPRAGGAPHEFVASVSGWSAEAPMVTIGLNTSGKTSLSITAFDFDLKDSYLPPDFDDTSKIVTSHFIPPGVAFQRQVVPERTGGTLSDDDYVPNYGTELGVVRGVDFKSADLTLEHNIKEWKTFRLRWVAGLKYAQLEQGFAHVQAFAKEYGRFFGAEVAEFQDLFFLGSMVETHGLGPKLGLASRWLVGEKKKWSFDARFDVAALPENTTALYEVRMVDSSAEIQFNPSDPEDPFDINESPVIPGFGEPKDVPVYAVSERQTDFTKLTWLATGRVGFRFKPKGFFTVGLDAWQMRWLGLLSQSGVVETVHEFGEFDIRRGNPNSGDPDVRASDPLLRVPRFAKRDDFVFDGVSLNLTFDF